MTDAAKPPTIAAPETSETSSLAPFRSSVFAVLWLATVVSNIGTWMQNAASGWLMTGLDPDPFVVSLVQVAGSLPMFLFALPAGALADVVDRRRLLIVMQILTVVLVAIFAAVVALGRADPVLLLSFSFCAATLAALIMPAWQSIVPQLIPSSQLAAAVALNSIGLNVSRAVGPALAGLFIAVWGIAAPFWFNALSTIGVIAALAWWKPPRPEAGRVLPPEQFGRAMRAGLRHARHNPHLQATLIRAFGFFVFASAYWALLPLLARDQIAGGPELYGILLGAIGASAVAGAFALPRLKRSLGADGVVVAGTLGTVLALVLFALARQPATALIACIIAGAAWIAVIATLNVAAQVSLPGWVRGRGLSIFGTTMFGALTLGSAVWGKVAGSIGLPATHLIAGVGALLAIPLLRRWKLQAGAGLDLTPSMHWPVVIPAPDVELDRGPVLVTVDYRIRPEDGVEFLRAVNKLARERGRDGAYDWGIFEDVESAGHFVETFMLDSWIEHLRQHERVTAADRDVQRIVNRFQREGAPKVSHLVSAASPIPLRRP
ncbi:MFS transporter [Microbacteriaceae bacterium K1510]|nr:MFS transporter [Microbacteriaceae bacterium K1510]